MHESRHMSHHSHFGEQVDRLTKSGSVLSNVLSLPKGSSEQTILGQGKCPRCGRGQNLIIRDAEYNSCR